MEVYKLREKFASISRYGTRGNNSGSFYSPIAVGEVNFHTPKDRITIWTEDKEPPDGISMWPDEAVELGIALVKAGIKVDLEWK